MYQHYNPYTGQVLPGLGAYASPTAIHPNLMDSGMSGLGEQPCNISKFIDDNMGTIIAFGVVALILQAFRKKGHL